MIVFIFLWIIAIIVLVSDPKSPVQRWFSATTFLAGLGPFIFFVEEKVSPWLINYPWLRLFNKLLVASSIYLFPYAFLMFAVYYFTNITGNWREWRKPLALILVLPAILMYGVFPISVGIFNRAWQYQLINLWVVPYLIAGNGLLIASHLRAQSRRQRNDSFMTCLIITPISLIDLFTGYIVPGLGIYTVPLNSILITILFVAFFSIITRYGALGVKLRIDRFQLESAMKTMASGAAILNHSIKNEIGTILKKLNVSRLKDAIIKVKTKGIIGPKK